MMDDEQNAVAIYISQSHLSTNTFSHCSLTSFAASLNSAKADRSSF